MQPTHTAHTHPEALPGRELIEDIAARTSVRSYDAATRALVERAERYAALATLLRSGSSAWSMALDALSTPCRYRINGCPVPELVPTPPTPDPHGGGGPVDHALALEHARLFTDGGARGPLVPACQSDYLACDAIAVEQVAAFYRDWGYGLSDDPLVPDCVYHISNELEFVAHCLMLECDGVQHAYEAAASFEREELHTWVPLFATALVSRARHPVLRFVARTLETFIACETLEFLSDTRYPLPFA